MKSHLKLFFYLIGISASTCHASALFPTHQLSFGFYNHAVLPWKFPALPKPLFWNSRYSAGNGIILAYTYTRFHTSKHFSVNFGVSTTNWNSGTQSLVTLSGFFELRWWIFRTRSFNPYLVYSIAGPTIISRSQFAGSELGGYFLFQDYLGAGIMLGQRAHCNIEAKVIHYSNGDLAQYNRGLQVPFVLSIGSSF